ncbi:hypothetical protein ACFQFC_01825 [Amorphoplanes digitatis]|uniref:Uncharacterized protein n=1 Tax=Actinoplanes digitatis TaxID=1868 RepID=A0A7W7HY91_9ACTN|nr:hypothetical protein [Actinoplanes digitatis]MBB4762915.1 hypothetical protein [Actinoplanes digitatis]GID91590.1 hypothetical protein Adi01nite_10020 [Actinoplanes digitatis]
MFYFIAIIAAFSMICVLAWTLPNLSTDPAGMATGAGESATQPGDSPPSRLESLEGVLSTQLVAREITPGQYRRAVEGLAARDDERHPMNVPREIGPADA